MSAGDGPRDDVSATRESLEFLDNPFETAATLPALWQDFQRICARCEHHHLDPFGICRRPLRKGGGCPCRSRETLGPVMAAQAMISWIVDWARVVDKPNPTVRTVAALQVDELSARQWGEIARRLAASPPPASLVLLIKSVQAR